MNNEERAAKAESLLTEGRTYPKGCSEFVAAVLSIPWESANSLLGDQPTPAGTNGVYQLSRGDIVGWKGSSEGGHVAVFVGGAQQFIDVRNPGAAPRRLTSYGTQQVYKSSRC
jgi:hypothetical protein